MFLKKANFPLKNKSSGKSAAKKRDKLSGFLFIIVGVVAFLRAIYEFIIAVEVFGTTGSLLDFIMPIFLIIFCSFVISYGIIKLKNVH